MQVIDEKLLNEFREAGYCDWCKLFCQRREPHHLVTRGMGGGGRLDIRINIASLCRECHQSHHDGNHPLTDDLRAIVAARENTTQAAIKAEILKIRRTAWRPTRRRKLNGK